MLGRKFTMTFAAAAVAASLAAPSGVAAEQTTQVGPTDVREQIRDHGKALRAARKWRRQNPERYRKLIPTDDPAPGGVPIQFPLRDGGKGEAVLDSLQQAILEIGYTELKGRDPENLRGLYGRIYDLLPPRFRSGLLLPADVVPLRGRKLLDQVVRIADQLTANFSAIRLEITGTLHLPGFFANPILDCTNEVGWEAGGIDNENSDRCLVTEYASLGLMKNLDWVLKDDLTCVKDQKRRGSCVSHAINANVETMIQVQGGVPENLSEQDLNFWGEITTDFSGRYSDGLNAAEMYDALDAENFEIQYESAWNYNQSPNRGSFNAATNQFPNSCGVNYTGEMCTDYSFQAQETAFPLGIYVYVSPGRDSVGWEVKDWYAIPDLTFFGQPDFQIDTAILALETEFAVQISFSTAQAFRTPDADGYVNYNPADPVPTGKHAILAVGFVANSDLPAGVPLDPDGRGYVVIKNSWGTGYGDCGFSYLSTEFLRQWAYAYHYVDKTLDFG
jgi:hypothetical protein